MKLDNAIAGSLKTSSDNPLCLSSFFTVKVMSASSSTAISLRKGDSNLEMETMENREDKQEELYQYVTSENLSFEKILEVHTKLPDIQAKEEKNHKSLWSNRKQLDDDLIEVYYNISSEIERITQKPRSEDVPITDNQMTDESNGNDKAHFLRITGGYG